MASDICYPDDTDWSCAFSPAEIADLRADEIEGPNVEKAEAFAWSLLATLTNYRIGTCPVVVRPCVARCAPEGSYRRASIGGASTGLLPLGTIGMFNPYISGGRWYNACGCSNGCECTSLQSVILPGPVGRIVKVRMDGDDVPLLNYRVINGDRLIRTDGDPWPGCQDLSVADEDAFTVEYYRGAAPNAITRAAAGALASEFYKACHGDECQLPANVVRSTGAGQSYEFAPQDWSNGNTGIPLVNAVIEIYNPHNLRAPIIVASPDTYDAPTTTWARR